MTALDPWPYVVAAYVITTAATVLLVGWSWRGMRRAEARRDAARQKPTDMR